MALTTGARLGPYEVMAPLGAGGMGEVYRARDTRLDRTVAIKVLPAHLADNPHLRQRFEREARALSSLSHPHICTLFDVGHENGMDFLVMEYLEGETLAARLEKGSLAPEQVLRTAVEIADALEKAHKQGVIHRDLKPGNIMLTKAGAKLLDFGLAKAATNVVATALSALSKAPTESAQPLTAEGTLVGTFQYMAPEQLEGKDADTRSDLFALGAVLYEMATGRKAFPGKTQASIIAAILSSEPPTMASVQPLTPPALDRVVKACLAKDAEERWQDAHDLLLELKWIAEAGSQAGVPAPVMARRKLRERLAWGVAALAVLAALAGTFGTIYYAREAREAARPVRSAILAPENASFAGPGHLAVSSDGRRLAFVARGAGGKNLLWVRPLEALSAQPLAGTEGASFPFWSPDSRSLGFFAAGKLRKIDAAGGPPQTLCDASDARGGTWNQDGVILFTPTTNDPLYRVSAAGGAPSPLTKVDEARRETSHRWPYFLPDGRHFLYLAFAPGSEKNGIYVGSLAGEEPKLLLRAESAPAYAPPGYLLFIREETLMAQPFDADDLELTGEAFPVAEQVRLNTTNFAAGFTVSRSGVLAYLGGESGGGAQLLWFDPSGTQLGSLGEEGFYAAPRLSPDGQRLAVYSYDTQSRNGDLWLYELRRGVGTRFTFDSAFDHYPIWSPDGSRIVFASTRKGNYDLYQKASSGAGAEEVLLESEAIERPFSWSSDGRFLAYMRDHPKENTQDDIWVLPLVGDRKPFPFLATEFDENWPQFSPNGRWLAYDSNESGVFQVYLMPFPGPGGKWQASTGGGHRPVWRRDGKELFYLTNDNKLMVVEVNQKGSTLELGVPRPLFDTRPGSVITPGPPYDVSPDGRRFVIVTRSERGDPSPVTLVVNWTAGLTQ